MLWYLTILLGDELHLLLRAKIAVASEEGARFPISMVASGVWAGEISLERAHNLKEVGKEGRTMKQELARIGYLGKMDASYQAMPLGVLFHHSFVRARAELDRPISSCILVSRLPPPRSLATSRTSASWEDLSTDLKQICD